MNDFKGRSILIHVGILGSFIVVGFLVGFYNNNNLLLIFVIWFIGFLVDVLYFRIFLQDDPLRVFTKSQPYVIEGVILQKIKKPVLDRDEEIDTFYFEIEVHEAYTLGKKGISHKLYYEKQGKQRIEVPESMFLSLKIGQEVFLVCEPDDFVWGLVRGDEVINIEI
ncbi:MAG: hypothetical protein NW226_09985 [Microscillaceae bacterium]|nr:hypothetical protein [Microscillaceae bacterium]